MRNLVLVTLLTLVSCGGHDHVRRVTNNVANPFDNSENDARLGSLESRVSALEQSVALNISQIGLNSAYIVSLQSSFDSQIIAYNAELGQIQADIAALKVTDANSSEAMSDLQSQLDQVNTNIQSYVGQGYAAYNDIMGRINNLSSANTTLNSSVTTLQTQMVQLQSGVRVTDVVDPCPSVVSTGFKEYFFKLSDGKYIAYFEQNGNRFLTELLVNTAYQTTDSRHCNFTLNAQGQITH